MKRYLLVAGDDYERKGVNFRIFADNRMKRIVAANKAKDELVFQIMDVRAGSVSTHEVTYPAGKKKVASSSTTPFTPVTNAQYTAHKFKDGQRGHLSATDVYAAVRVIGTTHPGELHELSFFSHAWHGGPLLVNSRDDGVWTSPPVVVGGPPVVNHVGAGRDPDDFDPRSKDFSAPTMTGAQLTEFRAAFHADGIGWSWGCAFPRVIHEVLHKLETHKDYASSGLADTKKLVFTNFRANHIADLEPRLGVTFPDPKKVELTFGQLKRYFCLATMASYSHHLAVASQRTVFAGVIGTYSEYDDGPLPLMHVHKGFSRHFTFYANYLGFSFDKEGRKYGAFLPTFTC